MKGIPKGNYPMFTCIMAAFIEEGFRVVRGPDWCWGEQDGGEGNVGTVVEVKEENLERDGTVYGGTAVGVYWDNGTLSNYRCGFDGKYDVVVLDTAPAGVVHHGVMCNNCRVTPVCGLRWKCSTCYDFDLCSQCYSDNKHSLEHRFLRYDTHHCESTSVSPRSGSRRVKAKGFFKGAVVSRGKDWCWGDQDGPEMSGTILFISDFDEETFRSVAEVQWRGSEAASSTNIYRVGHKGKVDLKCVTAGEGGHYYPQHLPMADKPQGQMSAVETTGSSPSSGPTSCPSTSSSTTFFSTTSSASSHTTSYETTPCETTPSATTSCETTSCATTPSATTSCETTSCATTRSATTPSATTPSATTPSATTSCETTPSATTSCETTKPSRTGTASVSPFAEAVPSQVKIFKPGDEVQVIDDSDKLSQIQKSVGLWEDDMAFALGRKGVVTSVHGSSGHCAVAVEGLLFTFSPAALVCPPALQGLPGERVQVSLGGADGLSMSDYKGWLDDLQTESPVAFELARRESGLGLTSTFEQLFAGDSEGGRTLKDASSGGGVDETPLHFAVLRRDFRTIKKLVTAGAYINSKNSEGLTPMHLTCRDGIAGALDLLLQAGADPAINDSSHFNALHYACRNNFLEGSRLILKTTPHLLNVRKPDGFGPLHLTSWNGHYSMVQFLLSHEQCDPDTVTHDGFTPLHSAVHHGHHKVAELLIGYGVDLNAEEAHGHTALQMVLNSDRSSVELPRLQEIKSCKQLGQICSELEGELCEKNVRIGALACLLVREGADLYGAPGREDDSSSPPAIHTSPEELVPFLSKFAELRSTFHGSLRKLPKPTPAVLAEEAEEEEERKRRMEQSRSELSVKEGSSSSKASKMIPSQLDTPGPGNKTAVLLPKVDSAGQTDKGLLTVRACGSDDGNNGDGDDDDTVCVLCDSAVDVRIVPCGHAVLCRSHASSAKRCPQCRGPIQSIAELDPLCAMCQERPCAVSLQPCQHAMCAECAALMKRCFECKSKIEFKVDRESSGKPTNKPFSQDSDVDDSSGPSVTTARASEDETLCTLCCDSKKNTAFTCGHQLCYDCSLKVDLCPICREQIKFRIKLH